MRRPTTDKDRNWNRLLERIASTDTQSSTDSTTFSELDTDVDLSDEDAYYSDDNNDEKTINSAPGDRPGPSGIRSGSGTSRSGASVKKSGSHVKRAATTLGGASNNASTGNVGRGGREDERWRISWNTAQGCGRCEEPSSRPPGTVQHITAVSRAQHSDPRPAHISDNLTSTALKHAQLPNTTPAQLSDNVTAAAKRTKRNPARRGVVKEREDGTLGSRSENTCSSARGVGVRVLSKEKVGFILLLFRCIILLCDCVRGLFLTFKITVDDLLKQNK